MSPYATFPSMRRRDVFICGGDALIATCAAAGGGSVVNMSSVSWLRGRPNLVGCPTAKAGILGPIRTLARELGPVTSV